MQPWGCIGPEIRSSELLLNYKVNIKFEINKVYKKKFFLMISPKVTVSVERVIYIPDKKSKEFIKMLYLLKQIQNFIFCCI